jgi:micrococcal nuclease
VLEAVVFLAFTVGTLFIALGKRRSGSRVSKPASVSPVRESESNVLPFDAENAKPSPIGIVLRGSAYVIDGDTLVQKDRVPQRGVGSG